MQGRGPPFTGAFAAAKAALHTPPCQAEEPARPLPQKQDLLSQLRSGESHPQAHHSAGTVAHPELPVCCGAGDLPCQLLVWRLSVPAAELFPPEIRDPWLPLSLCCATWSCGGWYKVQLVARAAHAQLMVLPHTHSPAAAELWHGVSTCFSSPSQCGSLGLAIRFKLLLVSRMTNSLTLGGLQEEFVKLLCRQS